MGKPLIGINCDVDESGAGRPFPRPYVFLCTNYVDAICRAGGLPYLLPPLLGEADVAEALDRAHGLLFTGGDDLDPALYGQPLHPATARASPLRQRFDLALVRQGLARGRPILGICLGLQAINVALGGTLIQHIPDRDPALGLHQRHPLDGGTVHEVRIAAGSTLARVAGGEPLAVNSTHHQAVDAPGGGLVVSARHADGTVEAMERPGSPLLLAVQWHPERLTDDPRHLALFQALVAAAREARS